MPCRIFRNVLAVTPGRRRVPGSKYFTNFFPVVVVTAVDEIIHASRLLQRHV
jgi:hypothetical protein